MENARVAVKTLAPCLPRTLYPDKVPPVPPIEVEEFDPATGVVESSQ